MQPFYEQLCLEHFPRMEKLTYAVLALGDRHYEHFCKFGIDLDAKLTALGASPLCSRVDCDVDVDEPFSAWKSEILERLKEVAVGRQRRELPSEARAEISPGTAHGNVKTEQTASHSATATVTRDNPQLAPLIEKRDLTRGHSAKVTLHLAFSTGGTGLKYESGDACGVIPRNDLNLVADILQALRMNGNEQVTVGKNISTTLHDALTSHLVITRLNRKIIQEYASRGQCAKLLALLATDQQSNLEKYVFDRGLIDLLLEFPGVIEEPTELVAILPKLTPRLYSISSSPLVHKDEIHMTVAVVRYLSHNRERGGVCSTLFADRTAVADKLPLYIQPNRKFRLPSNPEAPMIMIGPGTGIAPFRAFLHERRALGHRGKNWLFFGARSAATDFLYRDELEAMHSDGHLSRLDTAFSRDQDDKVYVQDRMLQNAPTLWNWLQDGASIYVCGDASHMARDVQSALCTVVEKQGGMNEEAAQEYVATLKEQHRYHRDVY